MTADVVELFPGAPAPPERTSPTLTAAELVEVSGGYVRAADQLRVLHERGFTRAYIPTVGRRRVVLERAHYDAVVRGQFGQADTPKEEARPAAQPNRNGLRQLFQSKGRK